MHKVLEAPDAADYAKAFRRRAFDSGGLRRHRLGSRTEPWVPLPEGRFPVAV
jgi:hypothetical protein